MRLDVNVLAHILWKETVHQVDSYAARVAENRDVMAALDFARYVLNSRLDQVLSPFAAEGFLKVDAALLKWKAEELQRACQERFRLNDSKPHLEALQLQSIHEKLNLVAGYLSRMAGPDSENSSNSQGRPPLKIISGGIDGSPAGEPETERACG